MGIALLSRRLARARRVPLLSGLPAVSAATIWFASEGVGILGARLAGASMLMAYGIGLTLAVAMALMVVRDARPYIAPCCSFCGLPREQVEHLFSGQAAVTICDRCVGLCSDLVDQQRVAATEPAAGPPPDVSIDRDNPWDPGSSSES